MALQSFNGFPTTKKDGGKGGNVAQAGSNWTVASGGSASAGGPGSPTKVFERNVNVPGYYRITLQVYNNAGSSPCYIQVYRNGNPYGILRIDGPGLTYYTEDLFFSINDKLQVYIYEGYTGYNMGWSVSISVQNAPFLS